MSETSPPAMRFEQPELARIALSGSDRRDFLQRLATNDVSPLRPGSGVPTFLLERTGRVVDRLIVADRGDSFLLVGNAGRGEAVREWLDRYTIAEDVRTEDLGASTGLVTVLGDGVEEVVGRALGVAADGLAPWAHAERDGVLLLRAEDVGGRSYHVIAPNESMPAVREALAALAPVSREEWLALCVRAGVPVYGREFTERTIPLETRATDAISFTKGCFIGQEVIARLHNYRRVKRALVRLRVEGDAPPTAEAALVDGDDEIGVVTAAAAFDDGIYALGYVEAGRETPGAHLRVREGDTAREAEILPLTPAGDPA